MSNPYQLVVFDWEGTVADTLGLILHIVAAKAKELDLGELNHHTARQYVHLGLNKALTKLFPHLTHAQYEQLACAVHKAMALRPADVFLIPGVYEFIKQLQQEHIHIAIATNKGHQSLVKSLQITGLEDVFKVFRTAGGCAPKPCPQMLSELIAEFGVLPCATLMIGDSPIDMEMAKAIRVTAIGVDFYHQNKQSLLRAGASKVVDNYQSIADFLKLSVQ